MMRLFIALPLPATVEQQLARIIADLRAQGGPVKWVEPHNIHLTLRFLGDTEEPLLPQLKQAIDHLVADRTAIHSQIDQLGVFPNLKRPNVIWVGMSQQVDKLADMNRAIEQTIRSFDFEPDNKSFKAHVTLGRVKDQRNLDALTTFLPTYRFPVIPILFDRVLLIRSTLTPHGPVYNPLHEALLRASA